MQRIGMGQMINVFRYFKSAEQNAAEVNRRRAAIQAAYDDRRIIGMGEVPRATDEARAYAFALDLVRRLGASDASRMADLVVRNVQLLSREPR